MFTTLEEGVGVETLSIQGTSVSTTLTLVLIDTMWIGITGPMWVETVLVGVVTVLSAQFHTLDTLTSETADRVNTVVGVVSRSAVYSSSNSNRCLCRSCSLMSTPQ